MCPTRTVSSFSFFITRSVHFSVLCSFVQQLELRQFKTLETPEPGQNKKKRPETRKHTKDLLSSLKLFFGTVRLFQKFFGLHQRVPPSFVSIFCNRMDVKKSLLHFWALRHCSKISFQKFFPKFCKVSKGSPLHFFHILQPTGVSQSPKGPPFYNFEP